MESQAFTDELNQYVDVLMKTQDLRKEAHELGILTDKIHMDINDEAKDLDKQIKRTRGRPKKHDKVVKESKPRGRRLKPYIDPSLLTREEKKRQDTAKRRRAHYARQKVKAQESQTSIKEYDTDESIEII